jgi:hypothetical protein
VQHVPSELDCLHLKTDGVDYIPSLKQVEYDAVSIRVATRIIECSCFWQCVQGVESRRSVQHAGQGLRSVCQQSFHILRDLSSTELRKRARGETHHCTLKSDGAQYLGREVPSGMQVPVRRNDVSSNRMP